MVLFHNRGVLHSVMGAFTPDQLRMFHQVSLPSTRLERAKADGSATWLLRMILSDQTRAISSNTLDLRVDFGLRVSDEVLTGLL
jgi:hypothetical protein